MLIEMSIKGLMVDPITNMPIVILKDKLGERVLSIWVGIFEANAIALQIENVSTPRPMTHDLLRTSSRTSTGASTGLWSATSRTTLSSRSFT
jgi:bifunctional DNase/RNase